MISSNVQLTITEQVSAKESNFAVGVRSTRAKQRSFVEAMKGDFGFLNYEVGFRVIPSLYCNCKCMLYAWLSG